MIWKQLLISFFVLIGIRVAGGEVPSSKLTLSYALNATVCKAADDLLRADRLCRKDDSHCDADIGGPQIKVDETAGNTFERIVDNQYGYTTVAKSKSANLQKSSIIHLSDFQGDRNPRMLETWQVDADHLSRVLAIPPGPTPVEQRTGLDPSNPKLLLAGEFSALIKGGKKISDEWSPIIEIEGRSYAVVRQCSGRWVFGGYYACLKVVKLTVLLLADGTAPKPFCRFSKRKAS
jgi:hypothetical protein